MSLKQSYELINHSSGWAGAGGGFLSPSSFASVRSNVIIPPAVSRGTARSLSASESAGGLATLSNERMSVVQHLRQAAIFIVEPADLGLERAEGDFERAPDEPAGEDIGLLVVQATERA